MTGAGRSIAKASWRSTEVFIVVGVFYLLLVTVATFILHRVERAMAIPRLRVQARLIPRALAGGTCS